MEGLRRGRKRRHADISQQGNMDTRLCMQFHHSLKEVKKTVKKIKTFETRKLVKRLKDLNAKGSPAEDIKDLEAQLEALKETSNETIAITALKTKIQKDRAISHNANVQTAVLKELHVDSVEPLHGILSVKIQNRLLSSKILAIHVVSVIDAIKSSLYPSTGSKLNGTEDTDARLYINTKPSSVIAGEADNEEIRSEKANLLSDEAGVDDAGWESGTVNGDEEIADRERELGSSQEQSHQLLRSSADGSSVPAKNQHNAIDTGTISKGKGISSAFIPSLSVGFVRGGSDDSELGQDEAAATDIVFKKNRRGQRARQAIWEKKYGRNANHKKKETRLKSSHDQRQRSNRYTPRETGTNNSGTSLETETMRKDVKQLHPSWEAKIKQKETQRITSVPNKKIKFV